MFATKFRIPGKNSTISVLYQVKTSKRPLIGYLLLWDFDMSISCGFSERDYFCSTIIFFNPSE